MLIIDDRKFIEAAFASEDELKRFATYTYDYFFYPAFLYFPKSLIRTKDGFGAIPAGFVIDLSARQWFMVEVELAKHIVWSHIAPQVVREIIAAMNLASRQLPNDMIIEKVREDAAAIETLRTMGLKSSTSGEYLGRFWRPIRSSVCPSTPSPAICGSGHRHFG